MSGTGGLVLRVVRSLAEHRVAWDRLVVAQPLPSPFLRTWWLEAVTGPHAAHLLILDGAELVGGVPLTRQVVLGVDVYRLAGQGGLCPDHLDAMAAPGREDEVLAVLAAWFDRPGNRVALLSGLVEGSLLERAWPGTASLIDVAPYGELPRSAHDYLMSLSSKARHNVRRSQRRFEEAGAKPWTATSDTLERAMSSFRTLQEGRPGRAHLLRELPQLETAIAAGMAAGEAVVEVLSATDGSPVAVSVYFVTAERASLYQVARTLDPEFRGAGTAQMALVIGELAEQGAREIDLLRGGETYKNWFVHSRRDVVKLVASHGRRGQVVLSLLASRDRGRRWAIRWRDKLRGTPPN